MKETTYRLLNLSLILVLLFNSSAHAQSEPPSTESIALVVGPSSSGNQQTSSAQTPPTITAQSTENLTPTELMVRIAEISNKAPSTGVVLATDRTDVLVDAAATVGAKNVEENFRFIPLGEKSNFNLIQQKYRKHQEQVKKTLEQDKLTVILLTITTGIDSLIWIQATSLTFPQKLSMVSFNLLIAATFGLDRDFWGRLNQPLKDKMFSLLDRLGGKPKDESEAKAFHKVVEKTKMISSQFTSYFVWGTVFYVLRTGLLSFEHLQASLTSSGYWEKAVTIMAISTATNFAWSELNMKVDAERHPITKTNLKRIADLRSIIIALFASTSMVLQPNIYGHTPLVALLIHGAIGFVAFKNVQNVIDYLENNPKSVRFFQATQGIEGKINRVLDLLKFKKNQSLKCPSVFNG
jgi:hypothetical protein